jgi:hypothetical protein
MQTAMQQLSCLFIVAMTVSQATCVAEERAFHVVGYLPDYRLAAFDAEAVSGVTDLI